MSTAPRRIRETLVSAAIVVVSLGWLLSFRPFERPLTLDAATWDYMSVRLIDGLVPYRDVFLHKTPVAAVVGAVGAALARACGQAPVHGAHALYLLLGATAPLLLFHLCRRRLPAAAALAAPVFLLAFDQWSLASLEGVRPKVLTSVLGLACLLAADHRRWLLAGLLGGAATMTWQPGLAFLVGAASELARLEPSGRGRVLARLAAGAAAVPAALLAWLALVGGFIAFFQDAVVFNVHYIDAFAKTPLDTASRLLASLGHWDRAELVLLPLAIVGLLARPAGMPRGLAVAGLVYLSMTFVSFQAWPDTILFGAPLAAVLAAGLYAAVRLVATDAVAGAVVSALAAATLLAVPTHRRFDVPITYQQQRAAMQALAAGLERDDGILAVSLPELLIHTDSTNAWAWPYMWFGVDRFAAEHTDGGFDGLLAGVERLDPELVVIARRWSGPLREQFDRWLAERYACTRTRIYPHTVRPILACRKQQH